MNVGQTPKNGTPLNKKGSFNKNNATPEKGGQQFPALGGGENGQNLSGEL